MPSQVEFDRVTKIVIQPIKRHWPGEMDADTIDDYVRSLSRYNERKLADAMANVISGQKRKPTIAHIIDELNKENSDKNETADAWYKVQIATEESKMVRVYTSALDYHQRTIRENKERLNKLTDHAHRWLSECIYESAKLQAQIIEGVRNPAYSSMMAFSIHHEKPSYDEKKKWWLKMNSDNAKSGDIYVEIPWVWFEQ